MGDLPGGQVVKTLLFYCMRGGFDPWWGNWDPTCHCYCSCCCWVASVVSDSATPETAAHQAPLSLGFSRKDHWSGLPFPSPMHDSEKWKGSHSVVSDFATPWTAAYQASLSMGFSRQEYWSRVPLPSPPTCHKAQQKKKKRNGLFI